MATVVNADIYKQIDRINKRIEQAARADKLLEVDLIKPKYEAVLRAAIKPEFLKQGKYGLTISKSKAAQQNITPEMLNRIEALPTPGEYKAEILKGAAEETGKDVEDVTIDEMQDYADDVQTVRDAEDSHGKIQYTEEYREFMESPGTKSYTELAEAVRAYEEKLQTEETGQKKVVSDYDTEHSKGLLESRGSTSASNKVR